MNKIDKSRLRANIKKLEKAKKAIIKAGKNIDKAIKEAKKKLNKR